MKSQTIIMVLCWIALILDWTTDVLPHPDLASAMIWAWLILWVFGFFKREDAIAKANMPKKDERSQRQIDFMRKLEDGKNAEYQPDETEIEARLFTVDDAGNKAYIIIRADGTVETEGKLDPDILAAVKNLKVAIQQNGPEAVAAELAKQIDKINKENRQ